MRTLKILTIVMGVLIVLGTVTLVALIVLRTGGSGPIGTPVAARLLDEPAGTAIAGIALSQDRLALQLRGGGPDRVLLLDPRTGAIALRVGLAR